MLDAQVGGLLDASAGVVEEQDQCPVAQREPTAVGQVMEQLCDLVVFEEADLWWRDAIGRDRGDLLADAQHLRRARGDVLEQRVDHGEPLVASAGLVAAVLLEMAQESDDSLEGEIAHRELGDVRAFVGCEEQDQEPDRVAVAAHRGWPQALDGHQVIGEERVQQWPQRRVRTHRPVSVHAGSAKISKRRLASSRSAG